jgi:putative glycosyltransferase
MLTARLMTRRYVHQLVKHRENELDISGIWQITGYVQIPVAVTKNAKKTSTYTLKRKIFLTIRSITGFSNKPLIYIAVLGMLVLMLSFLYFLYIMFVYLFVGKPPSGFTSTILSIWFLGGLILFSIGIVAIYLSVIFIETKKRPYTIIRQIYSRTADEK